MNLAEFETYQKEVCILTACNQPLFCRGYGCKCPKPKKVKIELPKFSEN